MSPAAATPTPSVSTLPLATPTVTQAPLATVCSPSALVIQIATSITIADFTAVYNFPPSPTFVPEYIALVDGSLVTTLFAQESQKANIYLLLWGAATALFLRNVVVAVGYLLRARTKDKSLFYTLIASQALAPLVFALLISTYFARHIDCKSIIVSTTVFITLSYGLIFTGIQGFKAFRCLDRSRFVFTVITVFQIGALAIMSIDLPNTISSRRVSGRCEATGALHFFPWPIFIHFAESLFVFLCFAYAVGKSVLSPSYKTRLSLPNPGLSEYPAEESFRDGGRGWWGYGSSMRNQAPECKEPHFMFHALVAGIRSVWKISGSENDNEPHIHRKPSLPSERPLAHSQDAVDAIRANNRQEKEQADELARIPRRMLLRSVLRDELVYSCIIAIINAASTVLIVLIAWKNGGMLSLSWTLGLNWLLVSMVVMLAFGRVVVRHEREKAFTHPAWGSFNEIGSRDSSQGSSPASEARRPRRGRAWASSMNLLSFSAMTRPRLPIRPFSGTTSISVDTEEHNYRRQNRLSTTSSTVSLTRSTHDHGGVTINDLIENLDETESIEVENSVSPDTAATAGTFRIPVRPLAPRRVEPRVTFRDRYIAP